MKRRGFLKVLAGIAAAPLAVAAAIIKPSKPKLDPHKQLAVEIFGSTTGRMRCKGPNRANVMREYSKVDADRTLRMVQALGDQYGWRYAGRVHDSFMFELDGGGL